MVDHRDAATVERAREWRRAAWESLLVYLRQTPELCAEDFAEWSRMPESEAGILVDLFRRARRSGLIAKTDTRRTPGGRRLTVWRSLLYQEGR